MINVIFQVAGRIPDVVQQTPPQIYVTVQQPPPGGLPEWAKILISAVVGALFGVVSTVLVEWWKESRASRKIKKEAREEVVAELTENLNLISSHWKYLSSPSESKSKETKIDVIARTMAVLDDIRRDRFTHYFEEHKAVIYSLDSKKRLIAFYKAVDSLQKYGELQKGRGILIATESARLYGIEFLQEMQIDYDPEPTIYDKVDELKEKGLWQDFSSTQE